MEWNKGSFRGSNGDGDGSQGGKKQSHPTKLHGWKKCIIYYDSRKTTVRLWKRNQKKIFFSEHMAEGLFW